MGRKIGDLCEMALLLEIDTFEPRIFTAVNDIFSETSTPDTVCFNRDDEMEQAFFGLDYGMQSDFVDAVAVSRKRKAVKAMEPSHEFFSALEKRGRAPMDEKGPGEAEERMGSPVASVAIKTSLVLPSSSLTCAEKGRKPIVRPSYKCGKCGQLKKGHQCCISTGMIPTLMEKGWDGKADICIRYSELLKLAGYEPRN